jgi:chorismate synthase
MLPYRESFAFEGAIVVDGNGGCFYCEHVEHSTFVTPFWTRIPLLDICLSKLSFKFSIGGIKGIEFGAGFKFADLVGSTANDAFTYKDGKVVTKTNNSGGVNGGITNGMPVVFNCVVKPTPSISKQQDTIDFINEKNATLEITGRHDPAIIRRICIVVNSLLAVVVCDLLTQAYGKDYLKY